MLILVSAIAIESFLKSDESAIEIQLVLATVIILKPRDKTTAKLILQLNTLTTIITLIINGILAAKSVLAADVLVIIMPVSVKSDVTVVIK